MKQETATLSNNWPLPGLLAARLALLPTWVWVAVLTALGFALRLHHIGSESFWFDEADIVRQAQAPAMDILSSFSIAGANGPLYTLLLHFWISLFGTGEGAVRTLSLLFGAVAIPAIYYLGKRLLNRTLGLFAAALLTVSPFHIWHSQDAKMYTMVVLLAILSSVVYLLALERDRPRLWALYVIITWISLSTHIFAAMILAAQLLATPMLWWLRDSTEIAAARAGRMRHWFIALLVMVAPFLPLAFQRAEALTLGNIDSSWYPVGGFGDMIGSTLISLSINRASQPWELVGTALMVGLFLLGAIPWAWSRLPVYKGANQSVMMARRSWAFLGFAILVPLVIFGLISLRVSLFEPRYMIIILPFYLLLIAAGLLRLNRMLPLLGIVGLVVALLPAGIALTGVNYSAEPQKEEWRQAMAYIRDHVRSRDVIIVDPGYLKTAVEYYYGGTSSVPVVPVVGVPNLATEHFGERQLDAWLNDQITDHERAWIITSPPRTVKEDPGDKVRWFFEGNAPDWRMFDHPHEFIGVMVYGYAFNGQPRSWFPQPTIPQEVRYSDNFTFRGFIYELTGAATQSQNASWLPLTLYWRFQQQPRADQNYEMILQLRDKDGKEWANWVAQPLNGYRPTSEFAPDRDIIDYRDVWVGGDVPPGVYTIDLTIYPIGHPESPLHVTDGATVGATTITLREPITIKQWQAPTK